MDTRVFLFGSLICDSPNNTSVIKNAAEDIKELNIAEGAQIIEYNKALWVPYLSQTIIPKSGEEEEHYYPENTKYKREDSPCSYCNTIQWGKDGTCRGCGAGKETL